MNQLSALLPSFQTEPHTNNSETLRVDGYNGNSHNHKCCKLYFLGHLKCILLCKFTIVFNMGAILDAISHPN